MRARGVVVAAALAGAASGVVVPSLRGLAAQLGGHAPLAGWLMAAHVLGGVAGAVVAPRLVVRLGGPRRLATLALAAAAVLVAAVAMIPITVATLLGVRALEGACHLCGVTCLLAAGTGEPSAAAGKRAALLGVVLVLGVGVGLAVGGLLGRPPLALTVAALLSIAAAIASAWALRGAPPVVIAPRPRHGARASAPGLLAFGERFTFGMLAVVVPFVLDRRAAGAVLGTFTLAAVAAVPVARRLATRWGVRSLACRAATVLATALLAAPVPGLLAGPSGALWAVAGGVGAGGLYAAALLLVASAGDVTARMRAAASLHAAGNAGHAAGAILGGALAATVAPTLVLAGLGAMAVALGVLGAVWSLSEDAKLVTGAG